MAADWPSTDARRASQLREALKRSAAMLTPDRIGAEGEGDFGRALVEIAARLAEHSTTRLDRTALRDKLAFLDMVDVVTPAPQSATVPIVFTLAEKRLTPVFAPARVQLSAKPDAGNRSDAEEITFETRDAIDLSPARLAELIAADPATDRIERAPAFVTRGLDREPPATQYRLLSAVETDADALQLSQAVGIEPGDLLRVAGVVYRVDKLDGNIVRLRDTLAGPSPAGAKVEKLISLEAFELRNLQDHAVYVGHKELLKLDGPAEIVLVFDPPSLPSRLAGLDIEYCLWGTRDHAAEPGWHDLELLRADEGGLRLAKTWTGSVDEREIGGGKSRWVRMRLLSPIEGACGPATSTVSLALKVKSAAVRSSVTAAFYNGQPLPTATAFFPFGPEPNRFDIFAFAASEALSKKGARLKIRVTLNDASLNSMASTAPPDVDAAHVYGVSGTGRLQSVYFDPHQSTAWRQIGLAPPSGAAAAAGAEGGAIKLDPDLPLHALRVGNQDLVFVRDAGGDLRLVRIERAEPVWTVKTWEDVLLPVKERVLAFCVIPIEAGEVRGILLVACASGLYRRQVLETGTLTPAIPLGATPGQAKPAALAAANADVRLTVIVLMDSDGGLFRGDLQDLISIEWKDIGPPPPATARADPTVPPVAFLENGKLVVVAARKPPDAAAAAEEAALRPLLVLEQSGRERELPADVAIGRARSITALPGNPAAETRPLIAAAGVSGLLIWAVAPASVPRLGDMLIDSWPPGVETTSPTVLLLPGEAARLPRLLLNAGGEQLLLAPIGRSLDVHATLHDIVRREAGDDAPTHLLPRPTASATQVEPAELHGPWVARESVSGAFVHRDVAGLAEFQNYVLLREVEQDFDGGKVDEDDSQLELDSADALTDAGDFLRIDGSMYEVIGLDRTVQPAVATLDRSYGATAYRLFKKTFKDSRTRKFVRSDRLRLASLDEIPPGFAKFYCEKGVPAAQPIDGQTQKDGRSWLLLKQPWEAPLPPAQVAAVLTGGLEQPRWAAIRLPREADNPALSWEYYDGHGWQRLDQSGFSDGTGNLASSGDIKFTVPRDLTPVEIAGKEDYWLRARLVGGDYGRPAYVITNEPKPPAESSRTSITIDRSRLNPPEILSIEATYELEVPVPSERVVADNNLAAIDQTQAALVEGGVFGLFEGIAEHVADTDGGTRALYLGFGRAPAVPALNVYADAVDRDHPPGELIGEVLTAGGWRKIGLKDETAALTRPGMLQLFLTPAPEQLPLFGTDGWWLRLMPKSGAAQWAPLLRGFFVNAVMAEHAKSVTQELVGSSLGEPDQIYRLAQTPVLPLTLELRVRESLGEEEHKALEKAAGDAIVDDDPNLPGEWVRWRQVDTFVDEDGDARVYRLDPATGEIRFGNGRCGKIPPAGPDSIRAFRYQKGGGSAGNLPARAIHTLSSAIESVELAINPVDASGGADPPRVERLAVAAPSFLRHADRALAPADIEALAVESAPDVVRARCLRGKGCAIEVAVVIGGTGARCPVPTRARREGIARNLLAVGWGALAPGSVTVNPPRYVHAEVDLVVRAKSAEAVAAVDQAVRERLAIFLHPVEGGLDGRGWPFGRRAWPSDIQHAVADIAGLDRIVSVGIKAKDADQSLDAMPPDGLICIEAADIALVVQPPEERR
ncbi:MAG: hypothetical protein QOE79_9 [Sphingomonadales bacterium]|jgi:hypothetical protein|nr:hypothetical protein [Sphingomonadales bacterium]MEA3050194.1 hypothetical protein [Sphingomonadales bacterium]